MPLLSTRPLGGRMGPFPVRSSFLPRLQLGAVALESLVVQIEDAGIARALATIVLARPERSNRWWIVVSGKLGHPREQRDVVALSQAKELQWTLYFSGNGERICCSTAMFGRRSDWVPRSLLKTR